MVPVEGVIKHILIATWIIKLGLIIYGIGLDLPKILRESDLNTRKIIKMKNHDVHRGFL
jgi:hypothetical protein